MFIKSTLCIVFEQKMNSLWPCQVIRSEVNMEREFFLRFFPPELYRLALFFSQVLFSRNGKYIDISNITLFSRLLPFLLYLILFSYSQSKQCPEEYMLELSWIYEVFYNNILFLLSLSFLKVGYYLSTLACVLIFIMSDFLWIMMAIEVL